MQPPQPAWRDVFLLFGNCCNVVAPANIATANGAPANVAADVTARGTCGYRLKRRRRLDTLGSLKLAAPGIASARNNVEQLHCCSTLPLSTLPAHRSRTMPPPPTIPPAIVPARDGASKVAAAPDRLLNSEAESPAVFVDTVAKAALLGAANGGRDSAAGAVVAAKAAVDAGAACVAPDAAAGTVGGGVLTCDAAEEADVSATVVAAGGVLVVPAAAVLVPVDGQRCGACCRASAFACPAVAAGTVANVPCLLRHRNCNDVIISVQRSFTSTCADFLLLNVVNIARVELYTVEVLSTLRPFWWCWSRQLCWRWQLWTLRGSSTLLQLKISRRLKLASPSPSQ